MRMQQVFNLYDRYNQEFFGGKLPFVDILFSKLENVFALTYSEADCIWIEFANDLSDREVHDTLLHEMIHVWQAVKNRELGHGSDFKRKAKKICKATGIPKKKF